MTYKKLLILLVTLLTLPAGYGMYYLYLVSQNNFHVLVEGEVYRSAQPTPEELKHYKNAYGIKSVVNLRGYNPAQKWYRDEIRAANTLGMTVYDIHLHSRKEMDESTADELIRILEQAEKPMLLHCHSGANRTGLASALYQMVFKDTSYEVAEKELSVKYGHVPQIIPKVYAMNLSLENLKDRYKYYPQTQAPEALQQADGSSNALPAQ